MSASTVAASKLSSDQSSEPPSRFEPEVLLDWVCFPAVVLVELLRVEALVRVEEPLVVREERVLVGRVVEGRAAGAGEFPLLPRPKSRFSFFFEGLADIFTVPPSLFGSGTTVSGTVPLPLLGTLNGLFTPE
jgi:hypothetical protein